MPTLIERAAVVEAAGTKPKEIQEFAGRVNSGHRQVSVARMVSPAGWEEPGQRPEFEEITVVLRGVLRVEHEGGHLDVAGGAGGRGGAGGVGALQQPGARWSGVHRRLPACLLAVHGPSGRLTAGTSTRPAGRMRRRPRA